jgi:hypothetical protein
MTGDLHAPHEPIKVRSKLRLTAIMTALYVRPLHVVLPGG